MKSGGSHTMKKNILSIAWSIAAATLFGQTYTHPTTGVQSTYNGACLVSTCSGTYNDNGGGGANYAANVNNIYRTFCPNTGGMCLRATFSSFSMNDTYFLCFGPNNCCDYLSILNGPAQNSPALYSNCTTSPNTITSTDPSGCLTFRFVSDGSVQLAGWAASLSCVACGGGPSATSNADCAFATPICSNIAFSDASIGPGIVAEGCAGCNTSEVYTNWYRVQIASSGTLAFTINPNQNSDDFDPVLYGPNVTCGALGAPIRCSYAASAGNGNTGLGNGAVDNSEDVAGDQWVAPLNVTAGQTFYLLINGWSAASGSNGFALNWTGTATLNCSVLPAEFTQFSGEYKDGMNDIMFSTAGEFNVKDFSLEKLQNGNWGNLATFPANGNNSLYLFTDARPLPGANNYRIRTRDHNGEINYSHEIEVIAPISHRFEIFPNPASSKLGIELFDARKFAAQLQIVDVMGRNMLSQNIELIAGETFKQEVMLDHFAPGIYFVKVGEETRSFIKE